MPVPQVYEPFAARLGPHMRLLTMLCFGGFAAMFAMLALMAAAGATLPAYAYEPLRVAGHALVFGWILWAIVVFFRPERSILAWIRRRSGRSWLAARYVFLFFATITVDFGLLVWTVSLLRT